MSSVNTFLQYTNLPTQVVAGASAALTVPAAGVYPSLPAPALPTGSGLYLGLNDINGNETFDGHLFQARIVGRVTTGATSTFTPALYLGSSSTVANNTTLGMATASSGLAAGTYSFVLEAKLLWDSVTQKLTGSFYQIVNGVFTGSAAITATTVASSAGLQFIPTFSFGTTNASNAVQLTEFAIDRAN